MTKRFSRYEVFVWNLSDDLRDLRDACVQMTWDAGHLGRAHFSGVASSTIDEQIRASHIIVCLARSVDEIARKYFRLAANNNKPVLVFLVDPFDQDTVREFRTMVESAPEGSRLKVVSWDKQVLATEYLLGLHTAVRAVGPVSTEPATESVYFPTRLFHRVASRMSQWWVVNHRANENSLLKQAVADHVMERYLRRLIEGKVSRLFFESGTSVAFLAQAFADQLDDEWVRRWAQFEIETNNIFAFLEFLVAPSQRTALFPEGPPDHKYGATFGRLLSVEPPLNHADPIGPRARQIMEDIRDHLRDRYQQGGLIFAASSALEWNVGPHVGSYPNMLFKRAILEARCPTVLLLDEEKLRTPYRPETCYRVCDSDYPWSVASEEVPLAVACAFKGIEEADQASERLRRLGFRHIEAGGRHNTPRCLIAANDKFAAVLATWSKEEPEAVPQGVTPSNVRPFDATNSRRG